MRTRESARNMIVRRSVLAVVLAVSLANGVVAGQQQPATPQSLKLDAAIDLALNNYPAIRAAEGQTAAARGTVSVARTTYLPRSDLLWQQNRATRNSVAGLLLPQGVIPAVSGPVSGTASYDGLWGSAGGVLLSWEAFDFGLRRATVGIADSLLAQATAGMALTRLGVALRAADAFLTAVAADQAVVVAQANVERLDVFDRSVTTLAQNQLRPGADASRADAELAAARIQLYQSQRVAAVASATLAEAIGLAGQDVRAEPASLLGTVPRPIDVALSPAAHPLAQVQQAAIETVRSRQAALDRSYFPRVNLQSAWFARGAVSPGLKDGGTAGLWPDVSNWAVGLTFTFPVFDYYSIRARRQVEIGNELVERARYDQVAQALVAQDARARAQLEAARLVANTSPVGLKAARDAETQARARYQVGLAAITEVADALGLLAQAEIDDALARLGVWRATLAEAGARGDLAPFLEQVKTLGSQP